MFLLFCHFLLIGQDAGTETFPGFFGNLLVFPEIFSSEPLNILFLYDKIQKRKAFGRKEPLMDSIFDFTPTLAQMLWFWGGAIIFFSIVEILVPGLVSIWFVFGAIAALIVALFGGAFVPQIFIFLGVTALTLVLCRPILKVVLKVTPKASNINSLIGMKGVVIEGINNIRGEGYVKVNGIEYRAKTDSDEEEIGTDSIVQVERIEGNTLYVKKT